MISQYKQIEDLFKEVDKHLTTRIHLYTIGGVVLLYYGLKPLTKDIDIIMINKDEFTNFHHALTSMQFQSTLPTGPYKKMNLGKILVRKDFRIDLFYQTVCKKFFLSKNMQRRAKRVQKLDHIDVFLCSNEDIFVFKTFTERKGDLDDCISLVKRGLRWNIILAELEHQVQTSGESVWITWIGKRLDVLEERGINIPIMKEINKLRDVYFDNLEKNIIKN